MAQLAALTLFCFGTGLATEAPGDSVFEPPQYPLTELPVNARVRLPDAPDWLAAGFGSVWVVNYHPSRVSRINPNTGEVVADIPLAGDACLGMAISITSIWVPTCDNGLLNEIDPGTNTIIRQMPIPITRGREGSFAFSDGSLWIPNNVHDSLSSSVTRIDASSGHTLATIPVGPRTDVAVAGFGSIWAASTASNTVVRMAPAGDSVVARIPVGESPKFMAAGEGAVWVQNQADGSVSRIDPGENREAARIAAHAPTPWGDIATGGGAVWLSVNKIPVTRIDPLTNTVSHQFLGGEGADAIRFGEGWLWVADHQHGDVWRIDIRSLPDIK